MEIDILSFLIGGITAIIAFICGYIGRMHWHQMIPFHDPWYMLLVYPFELIFILLAALGVIDVGEYSGIVAMIFIIFDTIYVAGFMLCDPKDIVGINTFETESKNWHISLMVHYEMDTTIEDEDQKIVVKQDFFMPQTLRGALRYCLNAPDPLDAPLYSVKITRSGDFKAKIRKMKVEDVIDIYPYDKFEEIVPKFKIWSHKIKDTDGNVTGREPVYLLHLHTMSHNMYVPERFEACPDGFYWDMSAWDTVVRDNQDKTAKYNRLEVVYRTSLIDVSKNIIEKMVRQEDLPIDRSDLDEIIEKEVKLVRPTIDKAIDNEEVYDDVPESEGTPTV